MSQVDEVEHRLPSAFACLGALVPFCTLILAYDTLKRGDYVVWCVAVSGVSAFVAAAIGTILSKSQSWAKLFGLTVVAYTGVGTLALTAKYPEDGRMVPLFVVLAVFASFGMSVTFAFAFASHRTELGARFGSLIRDLHRSRLPLVTGGTLAAVAFFTTIIRGSFVGAAVSLIAFGLVLLGFVAARLRIRRIRDAVGLAGRPLENPSAGKLVHDLGIGSQAWSARVERDSPYRESGDVPMILGSVDATRARVRAVARRDVVVLAFTTFVTVLVGLRGISAARVPAALESKPAVASPSQSPAVSTYVSGSLYPNHTPIWVDIDQDGIDDVVTLRWTSARPDRALFVSAHRGKHLTPAWSTESVPSQWMSPRTALVRVGRALFLADSEGYVHRYDLETGSPLGSPVRLPMTTLACIPEGGLPRVWLERSRSDIEGPRGYSLDDRGEMTASDRPDRCRPIREGESRGTFDSKCQTSLTKTFKTITAMRYYDTGLAETLFPRAGDERTQIGYDPKTCAVKWHEKLAFTQAELHERPNVKSRVDRDQIVTLYQLASGGWLVGARDAKNGQIIWQRDLPHAEHGTNFEEIHMTHDRVYVAIDWRLEVLDRNSGALLGSI